MAAKDRIGVDVSDIKDRVEDCRDDVSWREQSLAGKIRILTIERLEEIEAERQKLNAERNEFSDRARAFILAMATNGSVDGLALARLASDLGISTEQLHQLLKAKGGKIKNGA